MRLLDLYCGAGGAAAGYHRAGFTDIVGVDINPQGRYPFEFVQGDALEFVAQHGHEFDLIHASPPCQIYGVTKGMARPGYPDLVDVTRHMLIKSGRPYVIENVPGAPLINPIKLCGTMFDLRVIRHRLFETDPVLWWPPRPCQHWGETNSKVKKSNGARKLWSFDDCDLLCVVGNGFRVSDGRIAMGINWMTRKELSQAIPPAYTEWLGGAILSQLKTTNER